MKTLSSDKKVSLLASDAIILAAVLILSYIESAFPIIGIPLPGFKLGLANIGIIIAVYRHSPIHGALISLARITVMFLLFGNSTSLLFSLLGSVLVILVLTILSHTKKCFSFIGISVISASSHNLGQLLAAYLLVGSAVISYIPFLLLSSLIFGTINGIILNLIPQTLFQKGEAS